MKKILIVRMSSMGDIIHTFPAVTDLASAYPDTQIHWVVEEAFVGLARLHPAVHRIIPFALRRWRKSLFSKKTWREILAFRRDLQSTEYDLVVDTQGLLKSAIVGKLAGGPLAGCSRKTVRDPFATLFFDRKYDIPPVHIIERNRLLLAAAAGYVPQGELNYGIQAPDLMLDWHPRIPYAVCLTATAREAKCWPENDWIALGHWLVSQGLMPVFPWGAPHERARVERLAQVLPQSLICPRFNLVEGARLLADARIVIGVDTGLMHLAAAVDTPTVGIFVDSDPHHAGATGRLFSRSLGGVQQPPTVADVIETVRAGLDVARIRA